MKAAILHRPGEALAIEDVTVGDVLADEVRIAVRASGLCHSDASRATGARPCPLPALLGHEVSGIVTAVGTNVAHVRPGDAAIASMPACGGCGECTAGHPQRCDQPPARHGTPRLSLAGRPVFQFAGVGGFAEEVLVDRRGVVAVPDGIPLDVAALFGCAVMTGFGAVERVARVAAGQSVAILGCGGVGLAVAQAARIAGAARILAIDPVATRRDLAVRLGATDALAAGDDIAERVRDLTGGGVDHAFEAAGLAQTVAQAIAMLRKGGAAILVGIPRTGTHVPLPLDLVFRNELRVLSTISGSIPLNDAVAALAAHHRAGHLLLDQLIGARIRLDEIGAGFNAMERGDGARTLIEFPAVGSGR